MRPAFSVITPCFNVESYVRETVRSVQSQTVPEWELLLVDDGSTDGTRGICEELAASDRRIRLLTRDHNRGPASARNHAIERAGGRFIAFLDADDIWYPQKLERQLHVLLDTNAALVCSSYDLIDELGQSKDVRIRAPTRVSYRDLLIGCPVGCLTAVYNADAIGKVFMPNLRQRQDWGLWMRVLRRRDHGVGLSEGLAALRLRGNSLTANKLRSTYYTWRVLREEGGVGPMRAVYGVARHVTTAAKRRFGYSA